MLRRLTALLSFICLFITSACAEVFINRLPKEDWYSRPLLRLTVFAAGQSDCMLLQCGGESMMVDGGAAPYREKLRDALLARKIEHFKYLLNTHYHEDHIEGLYWLMHYGLTVDEYLHPYEDYAEKIIDRQARTLKQARASGIPIRKVENGEELLLGEAVITLLRYEDGETTNGKSMMEHVRFGNATLLLTADIIGITQTWFARNLPDDLLKVDVLKAPHHGITPLTTEFLAKTQPSVLVITNDEKTARRTLLQAENRNTYGVCTAQKTTVLETDGGDWYVYQLNGF